MEPPAETPPAPPASGPPGEAVPGATAPRITRRRFIKIAAAAVPASCLVDAFLVEPQWLAVRHLDLRRADTRPTYRVAHFTDLHHKGSRAFLEKVVSRINSLSPDVVCFTGDLIEDTAHLPEALDCLAGIRAPLYGVPGNHEHWSGAENAEIAPCFESTGGAWLVDAEATACDGGLIIAGSDDHGTEFLSASRRFRPGIGAPQVERGKAPADFCGPPSLCRPEAHSMAAGDSPKRIVLCHYPVFCDELAAAGVRAELILAGHSHGGQVRLPVVGALRVPFKVGPYERGLYHTPAGPMHVSVGIGWWYLPVRFGCRPEIALIEI